MISLCSFSCHDLQKWDLFQLLFPLLSVRGRRGEEDGAPPEVTPFFLSTRGELITRPII